MPAAVRCASWARAAGVDPIGSVPAARGFLLLEWPLPWSPDFADTPALAEIARHCRNGGIRLQGVILADASAASDVPHATFYWATDDEWFTQYERFDVEAHSLETLPGAALDLVTAALQGQSNVRTEGIVDVLVCTHGRRDVCCGSRGTTLAAEMVERNLCGPSTRIWRTSHLGGHRFAPTALVLPHGSTWAVSRRRVGRGHREPARPGRCPRESVSRLDGCAQRCWPDPRAARVHRDRLAMAGGLAAGHGDGRRSATRMAGPRRVTVVWEAVAIERPNTFAVCGGPGATKRVTEIDLHDLRSFQLEG